MKVLIVGDSHVRRMAEHEALLRAKLNYGRLQMTYRYPGGARRDFAIEEMFYTCQFDVVVIMVGGNDLDSGAGPIHFQASYKQIEDQARRAGVKSLIITSIWPRHNPVFNRNARAHTTFFSNMYYDHNLITFWQWDDRQPFRTYDGVHLQWSGYKKAMTYLLAPILWVVNNRIC